MTFLIRPGTPRYRAALDHEADTAAELESLTRFRLAEAA
jgi:hypothetical protein